MLITAVYGTKSHSAYKIAVQTFKKLVNTISGDKVDIVTDDDFASADTQNDLTVLIGNDAVNSVVAELYLTKKINKLNLRYMTDDYTIRTFEADGKKYLLLAGGRPRASIYAVYRYFELFCGCRYFWDGDRIKKASLPTDNIDLTESPRFDYRGIRYFAHRSLHRFQAEHWSLSDWEREIDWLLKKRLNMFMLRIGVDDLFQKAFPDIVTYPERDKKLPEATDGFDDRTLFWSLEYRGELRRKILEYAFERDLIHPEDCGTMTHWYSRTPLDFLNKKKPTLLPQINENYNELTGRVWDIRDKDNFENYLNLTRTHVKEYGKPEVFHTIGLGERLYSADKEENKRMKLFVYHKIATQIKENYPNAPLFIASWDLWTHFTPEEVRDLVSELDPAQAIIFDYTSDTTRTNNFTEWGVVNKFPWIFGIFSGYEPNSEIRGYYELTNERIKIAKADPMCRGIVLWPELSHGDPFIIEYLANNSWGSKTLSIDEQIDNFCIDRYPAELKDKMSEIWHSFMPIIGLTAWSIDNTFYQTGNDLFPHMATRHFFKKEDLEMYETKVEKYIPHQKLATNLLKMLKDIKTDDEMTVRDLYDIARTIIGRYLNAAILSAELHFARSENEKLEATLDAGVSLMGAFADLLSSHKDYSLYETLKYTQSVTETNPNFEETLKRNASDGYCRSYIYENAEYLYLPEMKLLYNEVRSSVKSGLPVNRDRITEGAKEIKASFISVPLAEMKKTGKAFDTALSDAASCIEKIEL